MPELIAKPALDSAPVTHGTCRLALADLGAVTSIALFPGQEKAANKALKPLGLGFPAPNSLTQSGAALLVWTAREQAFLIGADAPEMGTAAAVTDQSGGWAGLRLSGAMATDVLMRLVPLDLRKADFPAGKAARVPLGHMSSVLLREADGGFLILIFRSMARTAWHEIEVAMKSVAARG